MPAPASPTPDLWLKAGNLALANNDPVSTYTETQNAWSPTAAGADRPTFISDSGFKSKPCVRFSASNKLIKTSGVTFSSGGIDKLTVLLAVKPSAMSTSGAIFASSRRIGLGNVGSSDVLYIFIDVLASNWASFPCGSTTGGQLVEIVYDGALSGDANRLKVWRNLLPETLTFTGSAPATLVDSTDGIYLGRHGNDTGNLAHDHLEIIGWRDQALNDTDREAWRDYLAAEFFTKTGYSLIVEGDSNTEETITSGNYAWPERVYDGLGWTGAYYNNASVGKTLGGMVSGGNNIDVRRDDWWTKQFAAIMGATNDIGVEGASAATLISRIDSWVASRRAQRFPMLVLTCLANADMNGAQETIRQTYNAHVLSLAAADLIAINTDIPLPTGGAAPYYADGTHINAAGHQQLADYIVPIVQATIGGVAPKAAMHLARLHKVVI